MVLKAYLLGSHNVELKKVKSAAVFLRVERIVDHEVRSYGRFLCNRRLWWLRSDDLALHRVYFASLAIPVCC